MSTTNATHTVLIHLNVTFFSDTPEQAEQYARDYLYRHNIPVDDVALIDVL